MDIIIKLIAFLAACRLASSESSSKERSGVKSEKLQRQRERLERKGKTLISSTERSSHKGILTMNELIQRALNASDVLMLPLNTQETTFQRCIDSSKKKVQDSSSNCSEPYCSPTQTQPVDTSVECIEFILPRCCENLYPKPVPRKLTISEAAQRKENLDWVFELVTHFPKVIVSIHYKCAWCFPDDLFGTLNSKDRRTFAMQRNYRSNSSAVVPFCSSEWSEQLRSYACPSRAQRIREVASFDDESTGNTKETGAFLRHAMNRRAEGYADFSVFVHASPAPHLGTGLFFTRFLLWAHSALASTADVPFLQINYRYKDWPPRKNVDCAWNTIFPESPWDDRIYDVSLTAAAQFVSIARRYYCGIQQFMSVCLGYQLVATASLCATEASSCPRAPFGSMPIGLRVQTTLPPSSSCGDLYFPQRSKLANRKGLLMPERKQESFQMLTVSVCLRVSKIQGSQNFFVVMKNFVDEEPASANTHNVLISLRFDHSISNNPSFLELPGEKN